MKKLIVFLSIVTLFASCKKTELASNNNNANPTKVYVSRVTVTKYPSQWTGSDLYVKVGQNSNPVWSTSAISNTYPTGNYRFDIPNVELNPNSDITVWFYDSDWPSSDDLMQWISFDVVNEGTGGNNPHFSYAGYEWNLNVTYEY